jgi:hypothetical protein
MPAGEVAFMVGTLFGDDAGRAAAAQIDQRIDRLPGLDHLGLVTGAVDRYASIRCDQGGRAASAA